MEYNKNQPWYKKRNYLHFDRGVSEASIEKYITSAEKIAAHSFYPFIAYKVVSYKIKKTDQGVDKVSKERPIAYSAHVDSHIYSYYSMILSEKYNNLIVEKGIGDCVLAFRKLKKSNIDFAFLAFEKIRLQKNCVAIALDVKGFFDNLDHAVLKTSWETVLGCSRLPKDHYAVFKSLTKFSTVEKDQLYDALGLSMNNPQCTNFRLCSPQDFREKVRSVGLIKTNTEKKGIPQGSPISALLSNIYMLDFDVWLKEKAKALGGSYFRYCDDILVVVPLGEDKEILDAIKVEIANLNISINEKKTEIRKFIFANGIQKCDKPLQYLGFTFNGSNILLRSASLARFSMKMKGGVQLAKSTMRKRNRIRRSRGLEERPLFKRKLYRMYSYRGNRNFLSYAVRAADTMKSEGIRKQIKPLWGRLQKEIEK